MDARLFDVLHYRADHANIPVADGIHVHLGGIFKESIHQDRSIRARVHGASNVTTQICLIVNEFHRAPPQDERRPHKDGISDPVRHFDRPGFISGSTAGRLKKSQPIEHGGELLAILRDFDASRGGADDVHSVRLQGAGKVERRLTAKLHDDSPAFLLLVDIQNILKGQRLEIEFVARIVIGRDGLRIRVHHDGLEPSFL